MRAVFRSSSILAGLFVVFALSIFSVARNVVPARAEFDPSDKIKELLQKRFAIRKVIHEKLIDRYSQGTIPLNDLFDAKMTLLRARLDMCESKNERIKAYEEAAESAKKTLILAKRHEAASQLEVLHVEAQILEIEIELERAMACK